MTRVIGRVSHPERDVHWVWDSKNKRYVEYPGPDVDELDMIGRSMRAIDREQVGLVQAIQLARANGFTWARIGVALGVSRSTAQRRFGIVDDELRSQGVTLAADEPEPARVPPATKLEPSTVVPDPAYDFSAMNTMTEEEILAVAATLPTDAKLYDPYLRGLREAIVVALYKRDMSQPRIATVIGKSPQRVSQILTGFYDRMERDWIQERAQWQKGG